MSPDLSKCGTKDYVFVLCIIANWEMTGLTITCCTVNCLEQVSNHRVLRPTQLPTLSRIVSESLWATGWRPVVAMVCLQQSTWSEWKVLPLCIKPDVCDLRSPLRSRFAAQRSMLHSAPPFFSETCSPLCSTRVLARSAPVFRSTHRLWSASCSVVIIVSQHKQCVPHYVLHYHYLTPQLPLPRL